MRRVSVALVSKRLSLTVRHGAQQRRALFTRSNLVSLTGFRSALFIERKKVKGKGGREDDAEAGSKKGKTMSADEWDKVPTEESMKKVVETLKTELGNVRVGRAEPSFLANVVIDGKPVSKWGQIQVKDAVTLTITPFDPANNPKLAKGLEESELKLNATSDGRVVVVPIPRATKELKLQKVKQAATLCENARSEIRKARKKSMDELKANKVPEDDQKLIEKQIQKLHDDNIKLIDQLSKKKEEEIMK